MPANHELAVRLKKEHENIRELILNLDQEVIKQPLLNFAIC
jgi:hypothetical protein